MKGGRRGCIRRTCPHVTLDLCKSLGVTSEPRTVTWLDECGGQAEPHHEAAGMVDGGLEARGTSLDC